MEKIALSAAPGVRLPAVAAVALLALASWLLLHSYAGIMHDATLYTLFALAKLHPDTLSQDVFLRFGSQDRYTLFTPIYSTLIAIFGLDGTATVLTLLSQAGLLACAWLLARRFAAPLEATLGIALLLLIPSEYGASNIFHYFESFLSPRLPAEALTVGGVVALLDRRYWIAAACLLAAILLHPLIGIAGALLAIVTFVVPARPYPASILAAAGLVGLVVLARTTGWFARPDATWLPVILSTANYLFIGLWDESDWSRTIVPLGILAAGWIAATQPSLRKLCAGTLAMVACGLGATLVFCDFLHLLLFMAAQPWRCLWLSEVIAVTLAPVILLDCWRRGIGGKTGVLLIASALVLRGSGLTLLLVPAALACIATPAQWTAHRLWRPGLIGASALLALALFQDLSDRFGYMPVSDAALPALLQQVLDVCVDGVLPGILLVIAWLALRRWSASSAVPALVATLAACACIAVSVVPGGAWTNWTATPYSRTAQEKFAAWRAQIPSRTEVWWPEGPVETWTLLDRPSYWSLQQMGGDIFSREKALLMKRRSQLLGAAADESNIVVRNSLAYSNGPIHWEKLNALGRMNLDGLRAACSDPNLGFVVSWQSLTPTRFSPVVMDPSKPHGQLYLYSCRDLRS